MSTFRFFFFAKLKIIALYTFSFCSELIPFFIYFGYKSILISCLFPLFWPWLVCRPVIDSCCVASTISIVTTTLDPFPDWGCQVNCYFFFLSFAFSIWWVTFISILEMLRKIKEREQQMSFVFSGQFSEVVLMWLIMVRDILFCFFLFLFVLKRKKKHRKNNSMQVVFLFNYPFHEKR